MSLEFDSQMDTSLQQVVKHKLAKTTLFIAKDVMTFLMGTKGLSLNSFQEKLTFNLDGWKVRDKKFLKKMGQVTNEQLEKLPGMASGFLLLSYFSKDEDIKAKVVERVSIPYVEELIRDLDELNPKIIGQMIRDPAAKRRSRSRKLAN